MVRQPNELFDKAKIKKYCAEVKITDEQRNAAKEWLGLLAENKLEKEDQNRSIFENIILQKILGFTVYDYVPEKANIDYTISNRESDKSLCIEVKGTSTKDLFAYQNRGKKDKENPIKQTWSYMGEGFDYGLCTNYEEFILLSRNVGLQKFYKFNFLSLKGIQNKLDEEKLKEFIGIFSKQKIFDEEVVTKLTTESTLAEQEFTDEFYKLYHETRLMLIKEFSSLADVSMSEAIHWAQIYLNRLIFIFFVEDHNFIPDKIFYKRIMDIVKSSSISEYTNLVSDNIKDLFKIMNMGSKVHGIYGFNGGLYEKEIPSKIFFTDLRDGQFFKGVEQNSKLSKKTLVIDVNINLANRYADQLNPIIKNLLIMDSYDFTSDLNVNILGHIFEQSISDLEEISGHTSSKRKTQGVFYTPEYVTDYICRNTIIPYLSKSNTNTVSELVNEYSENISELENKIKEIKIVDPACGSGAFLIKAVDILLEIYKEIQKLKPEILGPTQLKNWSEESEISKIIESNIYGVDINEQSVEITKLSLFLKLAGPDRKLISLSKNIKMGNSLIESKSVDSKAFDWHHEFPEVLHEKYGGFDIIIGNPPYLEIVHLNESNRQYFQKNYRTYMKRFDAYGLFLEKSISLFKNGGLLGVIIPSTMLNNMAFTKLRKLILDNTTTLQIVNLGGKIFKNVNNDTLLLFLAKNPALTIETEIYEVPTYGRGLASIKKMGSIDFQKTAKPPTFSFELRVTGNVSYILTKMNTNSIPLGEIGHAFKGIVTGNNDAFVVTTQEIDSEKLERDICKTCIFGNEVRRYGYPKPNYYVIYLTRNDKVSDFPHIEKRLFPFKNMFEKKREVKSGVQPWYALQWPRDRADFERNEKLLVQAIRNLALKRRIVATMDYDRLYADQSLNVVFLRNSSYDLRYVLGILNSNLVNYLFQKKYVDINIKSVYLEAIPIKKLEHNDKNREFRNKFIEKVNFIVEQNNAFDAKHGKFLFRLGNTFGMEKISTKIQNFYEMPYNLFINEIRKSSKIRLKDQDEWEGYFEQYKSELIDIIRQIEATDRELNQMVYELYGISSDEIKTIEENL